MNRKQKRAELKHRRAHQKRNKRVGLRSGLSSKGLDRLYNAIVLDLILDGTAGLIMMPRRSGKNTIIKALSKKQMTA